jgi:hypothetical protein
MSRGERVNIYTGESLRRYLGGVRQIEIMHLLVDHPTRRAVGFGLLLRLIRA